MRYFYICQEHLCKNRYNEFMKLKEEIKVAIARRGTTLKKVCEELTKMTGKYYSYNNISNKIRNCTIKFEEVQNIFEILDYELTCVDKINSTGK